MSDEKIIIRQSCGIGDIFFCQKIAHILHETYKSEIIWPVIPEFIWIKDYIKTNFINFVNNNENFEGKHILSSCDVSYPFSVDDYLIIPLERANIEHPNSLIMEAKYKLVNSSYNDWDQYFTFDRNLNKEDDLYKNILKLNNGDKYVLISKNYGSPPHFKKFDIKEPTDIKKVYLDFYEGFSLFDWCKVVENAKEIYMIDSSLNYILEKIKSNVVYLYSRRPNNWSEINYIFKKKYILMN